MMMGNGASISTKEDAIVGDVSTTWNGISRIREPSIADDGGVVTPNDASSRGDGKIALARGETTTDGGGDEFG
jgi:hypothetical protein